MNYPTNTTSPAPPSNPIPAPQQTDTGIKPTSSKKPRYARPSMLDLLPHAALELRSASTGLVIATPFTASIYRDANSREANGRDIAYSVAYYERVHGKYPIEYPTGSALPDGLLDFTAQLPQAAGEKRLGELRSEGSVNLEGMKVGMSGRQRELMGGRMRGGVLG